MAIDRALNLPDLLSKKSHFLFGPRATGKSYLIRQQFGHDILVINLLNNQFYRQLSLQPERLEDLLLAHQRRDIVIIDEVQLIPELLNEVHRLIEERQVKFLLTGSSARKLKRGGANLLAGRAREAKLFPLTYHELTQYNFDLVNYLQFGGLPYVVLSDDPVQELYDYVNTYLQEEIKAEAVVLKLQAFSRFLEVSAITSGNMLNFSSLSSDVGVAASTIREYYTILEDTFIGFFLPAYKKSIKRKPINTAKFYYFDLGVRNSLAGVHTVPENTGLFGELFEHFIALELRAYLHYRQIRKPLCYWQSKHGQEVDFIIGDDFALEIKSTKQVQDKHLKGLMVFAEENICSHYFLISLDKINKNKHNIHIIYWQDFLHKLWADELIY